MKVGDTVKFTFANDKKKKKEGIVQQIFDKKVLLKVDFPNHPGKTLVRKKHELK